MAFVPESIFPSRKDYGMTAFSNRLVHRRASREEVLQMRTWPWSVKPRKARPNFSRGSAVWAEERYEQDQMLYLP